MVRDFVVIDSKKVKKTISDALDMTQGDFSGNKLGLSSKIVPVVCLNLVPVIQPLLSTVVTVVQNTWYTLLDLNGYCAEIIAWGIANDIAENIEYRLTVDGVVIAGATNAMVLGTNYKIAIEAHYAGTILMANTADQYVHTSYMIRGRNIKLEYRKTSALNPATQVYNSVLYAKW